MLTQLVGSKLGTLLGARFATPYMSFEPTIQYGVLPTNAPHPTFSTLGPSTCLPSLRAKFVQLRSAAVHQSEPHELQFVMRCILIGWSS